MNALEFPEVNSFEMPPNTELVLDGERVTIVFPTIENAREFTKFALLAIDKSLSATTAR